MKNETLLAIVHELVAMKGNDMYAYEKFHNGVMENYTPTEEELAKGFSYLPKMD